MTLFLYPFHTFFAPRNAQNSEDSGRTEIDIFSPLCLSDFYFRPKDEIKIVSNWCGESIIEFYKSLIQDKKFLLIATMAFLCMHSFMHANPVRATSHPFLSGDTFRAIAHHIFDETDQSFIPARVKRNDIVFVKTDYAPYFFYNLHPRIHNPYILITHNSDLSPIYRKTRTGIWETIDLSGYLDDPKLIAWFAQNIDYKHPKLRPIPIGLANSYWPHGNVESFKKSLENLPPWQARSKLVYLNIEVNTNPVERKPILDLLSKEPYVYHASLKPFDAYLEEMKQYRYVICPPGNGTDCVRAWEALLLGCIPIMQHSSLDSMFEDLPVILIDDWSEINENFLERKYKEMQNQSYRLEKIYADYWINLIRSKRN